MIGVKLNTFNDNLVEPAEQDANSALTELDKGLRSAKVGEQCEAIVRFPRLFEKYPFPILINSSFLKLSDVFRMGNNFLRLWVLRVCQQSEKHLDKILNVDEFLRRVYSVLHSNDPVARALALRTLGAVAGIIPERQNVHHAIRRGLDSHDNVEVDAAIYATTRFAAHSNTFAVAMCNKISDMVESESTDAERRAKLVRALRTVHGGAVRAAGVLELVRSLRARFPAASSARAAVAALTAIAADTVVHVPDQVELLLSIAIQDGRSSVRHAALGGARTLAAHAALWPRTARAKLANAARAHPAERRNAMLCLSVMQILVECPAICALEAGADAPLRRYCGDAALDADLALAATAAAVLAKIMVHCYEENLPADGSDLMLALESLVVATGAPGDGNTGKPLRVALRCLVQLSRAAPALYLSRSARVVCGQLRCFASGERLVALLEALAALPVAPPHLAALQPVVATLLETLDDLQRPSAPSTDGTALVLVCTVLFQERAAAALAYTVSSAWQARVLAAVEAADGWTRYRVARAALRWVMLPAAVFTRRYGHHSLAAAVLQRLSSEAPSEPVQRWISTLHRAAEADADLVVQGISGLESCSAGWESCGGWSAAAGEGGCAGCAGCAWCSALPAAWLAARARSLAALARVAHAAKALCTQPPPAIAHANAQSGREAWQRAGAAGGALRRAAKALANAAARYHAAARTAFHADDATLRHLYISQHTYNQLAQLLDRITSSQQEKPADLPSEQLKANSLEEMIALAPSEALTKIEEKLFDNPTTAAGITHRHAEAVLAGVRALCVGTVWPRGAVAGRGGGAPCRVSLSPAARGTPADHAATLPLSHRLAIKLEGVILPPLLLSKRQKPRKVKSVQITVTATPHPRTNEKTVELHNIPPLLTAVQTVSPVRDFFSAQQLVAVPSAGLYTVAAEAAFVDTNGDLWNTGPRVSIVVKAHDDPSTKGAVQTARGRF